MNFSSTLPMLKVVGFSALLAGPALGQDLSGDGALSNGQEYSYSGGRYEGLSSDVVVDSVLLAPGTVANTVAGASTFLNQMSSFGVWKNMYNPQGYVGVAGSGNIFLPNIFLNQANVQPGHRRDPYFAYKMGPFYVDQVYGGLGALYSDVQGNPPGLSSRGRGDDNWAGIGWLSARFTTYISDRFAFTINPWVYYLPLKNEVGWALGSGLFGLNGGVTPQSTASIGFHVPVGRWDFSFYNNFQAYYIQNNILNENFFVEAHAADLSPVDVAGRYQFGGFGPSSIDMTGDTDLARSRGMFDSDGLFFHNSALFTATTTIGYSLELKGFYSRHDFWDNDMTHIGAWDTGGALLAETVGNFRPFVAYQGTSYDSWSSSYHWVLTGAAFNVNPQVIGYANAGYLWSVNGGNGGGVEDQDSWLGLFGLRHQISPYTSHAIEGGRTVTDPQFNARTRSDYLSYMIQQVLGPHMTVSLFAMHADRVYLGGERRGRNHRVTTVGAVGNIQLSVKSNLSLFGSFERLSMNDMDVGWDLWTYRASYVRQINQSTMFNFMYQYQDAGRPANPSNSFSEHLVYAGILKQF